MTEEKDIKLIDYIRVIQKRLPWILGITILAMVIAAVYFWGIAKPVYEAKTSLLNISPKFQKFTTDITSNALTMVSLKNLIESRDLIAEIRKKLGWENSIKLDDLIKNMEARLLVEEDTNIRKTYSPIIELYAYANTGEDAAKLANAWAELFIQRYNQLTQKVSAQTHEFILKEYAETEKLLKSKQAELVKLKGQWGLSQKKLMASQNLLSGYLTGSKGIESSLSQTDMVDMLRQPEIRAERDITQYTSKSDLKIDTPPSTGLLESGHLIGYEGQLQDIELNIKELEARQKANESVKSALVAAQARKDELINHINRIKKEITSLVNQISQQESQVAGLEREVATLQSKFILLAKRKEEADIEKAKLENTIQTGSAESDDIKIASRAVPPEKKIGPKRVYGTLTVGIVTFIILILIAFFQNYISRESVV